MDKQRLHTALPYLLAAVLLVALIGAYTRIDALEDRITALENRAPAGQVLRPAE